MNDDHDSNVQAGLEKSVRFMEYPLCRGFYCTGFLRNSSGSKVFVCVREVSNLEDVRFREVPLYPHIRTESRLLSF